MFHCYGNLSKVMQGSSTEVFAKHFTEEMIEVERAVVKALPQRLFLKKKIKTEIKKKYIYIYIYILLL